MTRFDDEIRRLRDEYERRGRELRSDQYALYRPVNLFFRHGQERELRRVLERAGRLPLAGQRILDVGCGSGNWLELCRRLGGSESQMGGIDLVAKRSQRCAERFPRADIRSGDASQLPWDDESFDIVLQATVFTSVLDQDMRRTMAAEMHRVTTPGGAILWYDFAYNNPANPAVRGVRAPEIRSLFRGCAVRLRRVTLAPPLARHLVPLSWSSAVLLEAGRILNTHLFALIIKPGALRWRAPGNHGTV